MVEDTEQLLSLSASTLSSCSMCACTRSTGSCKPQTGHCASGFDGWLMLVKAAGSASDLVCICSAESAAG